MFVSLIKLFILYVLYVCMLGQKQLLNQAGFARMIFVSLNSGHTFASAQSVSLSLSLSLSSISKLTSLTH